MMRAIPAVVAYEREIIRDALRASNKSVTKAAHSLGTTYQALAAIIESRHKELLSERSPIHRRRPRNSEVKTPEYGTGS